MGNFSYGSKIPFPEDKYLFYTGRDQRNPLFLGLHLYHPPLHLYGHSVREAQILVDLLLLVSYLFTYYSLPTSYLKIV